MSVLFKPHPAALSEEMMAETAAKLAHLLPHWVEHNEAHMASYRQWIERARSQGMEAVAQALEASVESSERANEALRRALATLDDEVLDRPSSFS